MSFPFESPSPDPRLTAYLLDELEPTERAAFEEELNRNPALQKELVEFRRVSSALSRAFLEEPLPVAALPKQTSPKSKSEVKPKSVASDTEVSSHARAARIARLKEDAPKLGKAPSRFNSMVLAMAASVALMGVFVIQQVDEFSPSTEQNQYVRVDKQDNDRYKNEKPLSERMQETIAKERTEEEIAYQSVADEVALGLALAMAEEPAPAVVLNDPMRSAGELSERNLSSPDEPSWIDEERRTNLVASPSRVVPFSVSSGVGAFRAEGDPNAPASGGAVEMASARSSLPETASVGSGRSIESRGYRTSAGIEPPFIEAKTQASSYGQVRTALQSSRWPDLNEVKIEELINYFEYATGENTLPELPVEVDMEVGEAPWEPIHYLVRITLKANGARTDSSNRSDGEAHAEVRFNPVQVAAYRLLGYDNGVLHSTDGAAGSTIPRLQDGDEVTALFEIIPAGAITSIDRIKAGGFQEAPILVSGGEVSRSEMLWVEVRHDDAGTGEAVSSDYVLHVPAHIPAWRETSRAFRWAAAVASFGMELKDDPFRGRLTWDLVEALARSAVEGEGKSDQMEFIQLIRDARQLDRSNPSRG